MFTGLIEEMGVVSSLERRGGGGRLSIQARVVLEGTRVGDSIAVNGACLTVVELSDRGFVVECMPETLSHTTLGRLTGGARVNLERSLAMGSRLGGHLVMGHVDAVAEVLAVRPAGNAWEVTISLPEVLRGCVASKGSVALDGISLTVMTVVGDSFQVGVIPHTLRQTTLGHVQAGQQMNVEADILARYVLESLRALGRVAGGAPIAATGMPDARGGGLTQEWLREQGFV